MADSVLGELMKTAYSMSYGPQQTTEERRQDMDLAEHIFEEMMSSQYFVIMCGMDSPPEEEEFCIFLADLIGHYRCQS